MKRLFSNAKLFLFAGQGTQEKCMLSNFITSQNKSIFQIAEKQIGLDLLQIGTSDKNNLMHQTEITQPLLLLTHYLAFQSYLQICSSTLLAQDFMIGHSLGQFSALVVAGSITLRDGLKLVKKRGQLMTKYTKQANGMLMIRYPKSKKQLLFDLIKQQNVQIGCYNSPTNIIITGTLLKIKNLRLLLKSNHISCILLPVSTAFHCKMLIQMEQQFQLQLLNLEIQNPKCKIISNYDCSIYCSTLQIKYKLLKQLTNPVLFQQSIQRVPFHIPFIEIGHKSFISKFVEQIRNLKQQ